MSLPFVLIGFFLLLIGGEALLRGAVSIGKRLHLSPLFIGVVIVGFGTSMPEMAIGIDAVLSNSSGIALGNAVGSNISNILFILAMAALVKPIARSERLIYPDGLLLVGVSVGFVFLCTQTLIPFWQGAAMTALLVAILGMEYLRIQKQSQHAKLIKQAPLPITEEKTWPPLVAVLMIAGGIFALIAGAEFLIKGATEIARRLDVPEEVIGLSVIAIGTSLPELASALVASFRGHSEVAYGNIFGSNLFNLLGIVGVSSMVGPMFVPEAIFLIDGPVMVGATLLMLFFLWTGRGLSRWEGLLMLLVYIGYIISRFAIG